MIHTNYMEIIPAPIQNNLHQRIKYDVVNILETYLKVRKLGLTIINCVVKLKKA